MKYVCFISASGIGGVWTVVKNSLPILNKYYDASIVIFTQNHKISSEAICFLKDNSIKYEICNINISNGWLFDVCKIFFVGRLKRIIGDSPAIIHSHDSYSSGFFLYFLNNKSYKKYCTLHGSLFQPHGMKGHVQYWFSRFVRIGLLQKSKTTIISCDPYSIPIVKRYFSKTSTIYLAINGVSDKYSCKGKKEMHNPVVIGYLSRLHPLKHWDLVAKSSLEIYNSGINVKLIIAGTGEEQDKVEKWCETHSQFASYIGNLPDIGVVLPQIDIHVLPTEYPEGLPMIILETMSAGIPTITTIAGSCSYAVRNDVNGYVVSNNVSEIVKAIIAMVNDKELYERLSENSKEIWREEFSAEAMVNQYLKIFNS